MPDQTDQIAFGLGRLSALWRADRWRAGAESGLTPTQAEILTRIAARPGRASDLAAQLGVTPATLSDSVSSLAARGLVTREPDPADRRALLVTPTVAGRAVIGRLPAAPEALVRVLAAWSGQDRAAILGLLVRLIRDLQEARAIPVQRMCLTCRYFRSDVHDDAARPHHCAFVNAAFGDAELRLDCGDHEPAPAERTAADRRRRSA